LQGPFFAVQHVRVLAKSASVAHEVADSIQVPPGANTLFTPVDNIVRAALDCPRVKQVRISRKLPGTLIVTLLERQPVAAMQSGRDYVLVDEEGVALIRCQQRPDNLPILVGLVDKIDRPGQRLDKQQQIILAECVAAAAEVGNPGWLEVDFSNPFEIACYTPEGVQGKLGTADNLRRKILLFAAIYRELKTQGKDPLHIDVRIMQRPLWRPVSG